MTSFGDEVPSDRFDDRYRHSEFLYSRNDQYKIVDLNIFEKQHTESYPLIDLLKFDCKKVELDDEFKVHYDEGPCDIYIKSVAANIIKRHHLKRNIYLQIMSIDLSDLIWKVFLLF